MRYEADPALLVLRKIELKHSDNERFVRVDTLERELPLSIVISLMTAESSLLTQSFSLIESPSSPSQTTISGQAESLREEIGQQSFC